LPDSPAYATEERAVLAAAIRELIDVTMSVQDVDGATVRAVAQQIEQLAFRMGHGRVDGPGYRPRDHSDYLPRSPIVGEASPLSPRLDWNTTEDDDGRIVVDGRGTFGAPYEGPPGFVHGGGGAWAVGEMLGVADNRWGPPGGGGRPPPRHRQAPPPVPRPARRAGGGVAPGGPA